MMTRALALVMLLTAGVLSATQAAPIVGADISHLPQLEAAGAKFYDHDAKAVEDLLLILKRNATRDYLDFAALADRIGELVAQPVQQQQIDQIRHERVDSAHDQEAQELPRQLATVRRLGRQAPGAIHTAQPE